MALPEQITLLQSSEFYDALATRYADISGPRLLYLNAIDELVIQKAKLLNPQTYLDLGCGDARRTIKIASALGIKEPVAVDESKNMLREVEQAQVHQASIPELVLQREFDVITALWNVFAHIRSDQRAKALDVIGQHLRQGGLFMVDVNNRYNSRAYGQETVDANKQADLRGEASGDVTVSYDVGRTTYATIGHVFHPNEIDELIEQVPALTINDKLFVDYSDGYIVPRASDGQILYEIIKRYE